MKCETYRGYDIWLTRTGYYRAYSPDGTPLSRPRMSLEGIKKLIRGELKE